jgi:murein DD-endopeptidase MepM/ murein hydrolase activator NlpD
MAMPRLRPLSIAFLALATGAAPALASRELETGPATAGHAAARSKHRVGGHPADIVPFTPSPLLRRPRHGEVPRFWDDGGACSVGCRPAASTGWPLRPFHRQHPLRAGIDELRTGSMHSGIDIQARNGQAVYAMQSGTAKVSRQGIDTNVQVGRFVYFHVIPWVQTGEYVSAYSTVVGTVLTPAGHVHVTDLWGKTELNPLRPGGRVVGPWHDTVAPVIGTPEFVGGRAVDIRVYDPQSYTRHTTYWTPVLAPAALAYRVYSARGRRLTGLRWALRGTHVYPFSLRHRVYAPSARGGGWLCFAYHPRCTPNWRYKLAGGLAPVLPRLHSGVYRLTIYAWDWAGNVTARDERFVVAP